MKNNYIDIWENWSKKRYGILNYDNWLDSYSDILEQNRDNEIVDLGCGVGSDTLYLIERGYKVLSCDFSREALKNIEDNISGCKTLYLNMLDRFPFTDNSKDLIIADLSLHYFSSEDTIHIMREIKRVLKPKGILLARVASVKDVYYGATSQEYIEKNYTIAYGYTKRFFDEEDINKFFGIIGDLEYRETSMTRSDLEYQKPKMLYEVKVVKG